MYKVLNLKFKFILHCIIFYFPIFCSGAPLWSCCHVKVPQCGFNKVSSRFLGYVSETHQQVCVFQVLFPEGPDLPLSSNVPDVEFHAMRGNALNVEALKWNTKLESLCCTFPEHRTSKALKWSNWLSRLVLKRVCVCVCVKLTPVTLLRISRSVHKVFARKQPLC